MPTSQVQSLCNLQKNERYTAHIAIKSFPPTQKKKEKMSSKRKLDEDEDASMSSGEEEQEVQKKAKTSNTSSKTTKSVTKPNGDAVFELGNMRKVTVSVFKGRVLVNIREFYEDKSTGEEKPGSKGIVLSLDQFNQLAAQVCIIFFASHILTSIYYNVFVFVV